MRYAFLIPARDEADALPGLFRRIEAAPRSPARIVVVDNGSRDATAQTAMDLGALVVLEPRPGYGNACQQGILALAEEPPDVVVFLDADDFRAPGQIDRLLQPIIRGEADLVVGERDHSAAGVRWHARLGNRLVLAVLRGLYGDATRDMGPFRAIRWSALAGLGLDDPNYGWYVQMQVRALRSGLRVRGVPVPFERRTAGRSKISGSVRGSAAAGYIMLRTLFTEVLRADPEREPYAPTHRDPLMP